jgi:endoglycosylceramidase
MVLFVSRVGHLFRLGQGGARRVLAVCAAAVCVVVPAQASAAPTLPLGHAGRWLTDAAGRVVMLHGTNMVFKVAPFYPAAAGFGASDAAFLRSIGFNVVRLGVLWEAVEPHPGVYDDAYLNHIANTVRTLARYGIVSLLEFHQDLYNERFQGAGFPTWTMQDDNEYNPRLGAANYFFNPALERAFDNFWADRAGPGGIGLQERYAHAWAHVAKRFRRDRSVLGYEVMNEPWPGSDYLRCPQLVCPASDAKLTGLERKVDRAIRSVDSRTLVFYEPYLTFSWGYRSRVGALHDSDAVFAWHDYCFKPSRTACGQIMQNAVAHAAKRDEATFMTEYGATSSAPFLDLMVSLADKYMVPWTEWSYCNCRDLVRTRDEGLVRNPNKAKTVSNIRIGIAEALVEPYPQVVSGTPLSWSLDRSTGIFRFRYKTARPSGTGSFPAGSVTEISVPVFRHRYSVRVAGGAIVSTPGASTLQIASCIRAKNLSVTVGPGSARSQTC